MTLYSLRGATPDVLPWIINMPKGYDTPVRTNPATFTTKEIADAGYVIAPDRPSAAHDWVNNAWVLNTTKHTALAAQALDAANNQAKLTGVLFQGVMCSATKADQAGLLAVLMDYQLNGSNMSATVFYFENGNKLSLSPSNIQSFIGTWLPFRKSFFTV